MASNTARSEGAKVDLSAVHALLLELAQKGRAEEAIELAVGLLGRIRDDNLSLERRLFQALRQLYGRKSEKVSTAQLELFLAQIVDAETSDDEPAGAIPTPPTPPRPPRQRKGRTPLPETLPREPYVVPVREEDRHCEECGGAKKTIGFVESEVLEYRPATFVVLVPRREKLACPSCQAHVTIADDDKLASRHRPGPALLADVLVGKWQDSLPIERQTDRYRRLGVDLAPSTLNDWAAFGLDFLAPVARRLTQLVLLSSYLQADDTTLKVLDPSKKPAVKRGHLWAFVAMQERLVSYLYAPTWAAEDPGEFLLPFTGHLQGDGYKGFDRMLERPDKKDGAIVPTERRLGCGMHIRRKFEYAAKQGDLRGAVALAHFQKIYAIEATCKAEGLTAEQRLARRQGASLRHVEELYAWIEALHPTLVPGSLLYTATYYAISQKHLWLRCFASGVFEIDNGEVERQLRRVGIGRKNYLFAGSDKGAVRAAIAYTILGTCRLHGVDPARYLTDVFEKIAEGWPAARIDELLPHRWVAPPPA